MAPDNWHHLEGVHPSARVFRLYVYDDFGRPLAAAKVKEIQARVVTKETFDPATRKTTEERAFALKQPRNRPYLEARIDPATLARTRADVRAAVAGLSQADVAGQFALLLDGLRTKEAA